MARAVDTAAAQAENVSQDMTTSWKDRTLRPLSCWRFTLVCIFMPISLENIFRAS